MALDVSAIGELEARRPFPARIGPKGNLIYKLITTTDHKLIGNLYFTTAMFWFIAGGIMALLIRSDASIGIASGGIVILAFLGNVFMPLDGWLLTLARFTPMFGVVNAAERPITEGWISGGVNIPAWQAWANMGAWFLVLAVACTLVMRRTGRRE
mgnify:CR=1 FL=1